ncbi:hypothetical protein BS50DRAFT_615494 [Corynespora cassiicola Philippines]|uniref:Rhodopsin domain-containing protein n=1 Tax=Corynespora cassiicola Philippines TaxID=1448308 RepID=A0A2T2PAH2_CORCC|nr:hypothetical protein BS50DRAFT_615494 [Corynespora cassiicola Philippines]
MAEEQSASPQGPEDDRTPNYVIFAIGMALLTATTVALRFWSRLLGTRGLPNRNTRQFWRDDWTALMAMHLPRAIPPRFWPTHLADPPQDIPTIVKLTWILYFIHNASMFLTKLSALLFLTRTFPTHANSKWWNYAVWVTHGMNAAWFFGVSIANLTSCMPYERIWSPLATRNCPELRTVWMVGTVPDTFIDLAILILPLPKVWALRISRAKKTSAFLVTFLGYSVVVVSLGLTVSIIRGGNGEIVDMTYETMPLVYWSSAQGPTAVVSICVPPMWSLVRRLHQAYLLPLSIRISSCRGTNSRNLSGPKRHDCVFDINIGRSGDSPGVIIRQFHDESSYSFEDLKRSNHSTGIKSGILSKGIKEPAPAYLKDPQIGIAEKVGPSIQNVFYRQTNGV